MHKSFEENKRGLLRHELGHWLVARRHNFQVGKIEVRIDINGGRYNAYGTSTIFPVPTLTNECYFKDEIIDYLERRIRVLYAGPLAHVFHLQDEDVEADEVKQIIDKVGESDLRTVSELEVMLIGLSQNEDHTKVLWDKTIDDLLILKDKLYWMADKLANEVQNCGTPYPFELDDLEALERKFESDAEPVI